MDKFPAIALGNITTSVPTLIVKINTPIKRNPINQEGV
jgi:hypothetical protein